MLRAQHAKTQITREVVRNVLLLATTSCDLGVLVKSLL